MNNPTYRIPKEHGAYVVLVASWLFGIIYSPVKDFVAFALVLSTAVSVFLLQDPFKQFIRPRGTASAFANAVVITLALIGLTSGIALIERSPRVAATTIPLTVIAAVYFSMIRVRRGAIARSFVGFAGLTLVAPLTMLGAENDFSLAGLGVIWLFTTLFFCTSIFCVAIRLREADSLRNAILYHVIASLIVSVLVGTSLLGPSAIVVMLIAVVRLILILIYRERYASLAIKYIGIQESVVALAALLVALLL